MTQWIRRWALLLTVALLPMAGPAVAADDRDALPGPLASVGWLKQNLARPELLLVDASPAPLHRKQHIPGAVLSDLFTFGPNDQPMAYIEQRLRAWGVSPGRHLLLYDQGGTYMATRLFWDLVYHGWPADKLSILDGGLAKWLAEGGQVTQDPTPQPSPGTVSITARLPELRVRLLEFLAATADPRHHVMLDALGPDYFFGGAAFFNRGGHMPHATLMPSTDFYNPDKTFKSPQQIRQMLDHLGITPDKQVLTYCGGGGAAAVPFFALKYLAGYPHVKLFQESQMGWLQDDRELPVWTYADPHLARDTSWLKAWASPMLKAFGLSRVSVLDLRAPEDFALGHVPLAVNLPAQSIQAHWRDPEALAAALGRLGVDASHEAVIVSDGGLNPQSALAFVALESLGQARVSVYLDSVERWAESGNELSRPAAGKPADASPATALPYLAMPRPGPFADDGDAAAAPGRLPRVVVASGAQAPAKPPPGRVLHLPYAQFLDANGRPKAAKDIWTLLDKAGLPRYAEIVLVADSPGDAAVNYVIFRMMGFAQLKLGSR